MSKPCAQCAQCPTCDGAKCHLPDRHKPRLSGWEPQDAIGPEGVAHEWAFQEAGWTYTIVDYRKCSSTRCHARPAPSVAVTATATLRDVVIVNCEWWGDVHSAEQSLLTFRRDWRSRIRIDEQKAQAYGL